MSPSHVIAQRSAGARDFGEIRTGSAQRKMRVGAQHACQDQHQCYEEEQSCSNGDFHRAGYRRELSKAKSRNVVEEGLRDRLRTRDPLDAIAHGGFSRGRPRRKTSA
jgi:hypothetical protein